MNCHEHVKYLLYTVHGSREIAIFSLAMVEASSNVMAHAQKPDFVFRRKGRIHLNRRGRQFNRLPAAKVCGISGSNAGYTMFRGSVKGTGYPHSIRQFPLHFPSRASSYAITFQLQSNTMEEQVLQLLGHESGPAQC